MCGFLCAGAARRHAPGFVKFRGQGSGEPGDLAVVVRGEIRQRFPHGSGVMHLENMQGQARVPAVRGSEQRETSHAGSAVNVFMGLSGILRKAD
jgi:hypothetical protein